MYAIRSYYANDVVVVVEKALNKDPQLRPAKVIDLWYEFENALNLRPDSSGMEQTTVKAPPLPPLGSATPSISTPFPSMDRLTKLPHLYGLGGERAGRITSYNVCYTKLLRWS